MFLKNRRWEMVGLDEEALDRFGEDAVEWGSSDEEVGELIEFTKNFAA